MKKLLFVLSLCVVGAVHADDVYEMRLTDGRHIIDEDAYKIFLGIISPAKKAAIEADTYKHVRSVSQIGFMEIIRNLTPIRLKDEGALTAAYEHYVEQDQYAEFCDFVFAARVLGIEPVVSTAQNFIKENLERLIERDDEMFCVKVLEFQRNRFQALFSLDDAWGTKLIMRAAQLSKSAIVASLIRSGVDVNYTDETGDTPLITAAKNGNADAVQSLVAAGASQDVQDEEGLTALEYAACNGHADIVALLGGEEAQADVQEYMRKLRRDVVLRKRSRKPLMHPRPDEKKEPISPDENSGDEKEPAPSLEAQLAGFFTFKSLVLTLAVVSGYLFFQSQHSQDNRAYSFYT